MIANFLDSRLPERFWSKCIPEPNSGCWLWIASVKDTGYAMFSVNGRPQNGHRVSYISLVGAVPDGLQLDHLCRNRACVNPTHLEPVTPRVNTMRGALARIASCRNGHPLTPDNIKTVLTRPGQRICRACAIRRDRVHRGAA